MNWASEAALILVSGAREKPKYPRQRRRARMTFKNPLTLAITGAGGRPARTRSK